ncbi:MAG: Hsp70 family protein, partial [Methylococcaceae bacterium]
MSLFDHIKKKPDANEEPKKNEPVENNDPGSANSVDSDNDLADAEPVNQEFGNMNNENTAESAPYSEANENETVPVAERRFSVGIDLGTTHCVLSYADITDIDDGEFSQQVMAIPQLTSPGVVEDSFQLPSFLYQAHEAELAEGSTSLPWSAKPDYLVGEIARNLGSKTPIRLVSSAKSWLCHAGVDCKSPILPADAPEEVERVSPFQATTAYLQHIRDAWQNLHPDAPLED